MYLPVLPALTSPSPFTQLGTTATPCQLHPRGCLSTTTHPHLARYMHTVHWMHPLLSPLPSLCTLRSCKLQHTDGVPRFLQLLQSSLFPSLGVHLVAACLSRLHEQEQVQVPLVPCFCLCYHHLPSSFDVSAFPVNAVISLIDDLAIASASASTTHPWSTSSVGLSSACAWSSSSRWNPESSHL